MRYFEICEKSHELASEIMETEEFVALMNKKKEMQEKIPDLLANFKKAKEKYEEAQTYGKYYPSYEECRHNLILAKETLYTNPLVKEYKSLERLVQDKLNEVSKELLGLLKERIE